MDDLEPTGLGQTTSLINMKEAFYLTRDELLQNPDGVARKFYQQAYRPGFNTTPMTLIEQEALPIIRDCSLQNRKETGYNIKQSNDWPILDNTPLSLQGIADDLKKIYYKDKRTISPYKVEQELKKYKFKFSWVCDPYKVYGSVRTYGSG